MPDSNLNGALEELHRLARALADETGEPAAFTIGTARHEVHPSFTPPIGIDRLAEEMEVMTWYCDVEKVDILRTLREVSAQRDRFEIERDAARQALAERERENEWQRGEMTRVSEELRARNRGCTSFDPVAERNLTSPGRAIERPTLGAMPDYIWRETRVVDLAQAIARAGSKVDPTSYERSAMWAAELAEHLQWLQERGRHA